MLGLRPHSRAKRGRPTATAEQRISFLSFSHSPVIFCQIEVSDDDIKVGGADVPVILSGEGVSVDAVARIPADVAPGEYFLGAIARPIDTRVIEYDRANNASNLAEQDPNVIVRPR